MDDKPVTPYDPKVHGEIPKRFLNCAKGDLAESQRRWVATVEWRASFGGSGLEYLLEHPPHNFEAIKACYPQYVHGMSKSGSYIYIERPGLADMKALLEENGLDDILEYYVYVTEWIWAVLDTREDGKVVSIFDCTGLSASSLYGDRLKLLKMTMGTISAHYPERSDKLFIINAPFWFSTIWRVISPMVDPNTRDKISILGSNYQAALFDCVGAEQLPACFGGTDPAPLGDSSMERQLRAFVLEKQTKNLETQQRQDQKEGEGERQMPPPATGSLDRAAGSSSSSSSSGGGGSVSGGPCADRVPSREASRRGGAVKRRKSGDGDEDGVGDDDGDGDKDGDDGDGDKDGDEEDEDDGLSFDPDDESLLGSDYDDDDQDQDQDEDEAAYESAAEEDCACYAVDPRDAGAADASTAALEALMKRVEDTTKACERRRGVKALADASRQRTVAKSALDEVRGRKAGIALQMTCVINADAAAHGGQAAAAPAGGGAGAGESQSQTSTRTSTRTSTSRSAQSAQQTSSPLSRSSTGNDSSGGGGNVEGNGGVRGIGGGGGGSSGVEETPKVVSSLALTFQLARIRKEAQKLCTKEGAAVKLLAAADLVLEAAQKEQTRLHDEKRAAVDALSSAFQALAS